MKICPWPARAALLALMLAFLAAAPALADMKDAWDAYDRGDYEAAAKLFRTEANHGDSEAQYMLGFMYAQACWGRAIRPMPRPGTRRPPTRAIPMRRMRSAISTISAWACRAMRARPKTLYRAATEGGSINGKNNLAFEWANSDRNLDQALAYAREVTSAVPKEGAYQDTLGWALYKLHRYVEALPPLMPGGEARPVEPGNPFPSGRCLLASRPGGQCRGAVAAGLRNGRPPAIAGR